MPSRLRYRYRHGAPARLAPALALALLAGLCTLPPSADAARGEPGHGFYTYADPLQGEFSLALMPGQRFMLVRRPPHAPAEGSSGWFLVRGDEVRLSSPHIEAKGRLDRDTLYLDFGGGLLPFHRAGRVDAAPAGTGPGSATAIRAAAPGELPVSIGYWTAAAVPLLVLIVLLAVMHWQPAPAAALAAAAAALVAMALYEAPLHAMAVASGKAIWDAFFVMYVVWPALVLYSLLREAKAFERIESALEGLIRSRTLLILAVAWTFASFIQGIVGEGVPLAITIPLMLQLRVKPVYAVLLPLIGRTWGNIFGSMGEGWLVALRVADIPGSATTAIYTAVLLVIPDLLAGFSIAWLYGRGWAVKRAFPALLVIAGVHSGVQLVLAAPYPRVAGFAAAAAGLLAVLLLGRWGPYTRKDSETPERIFASRGEEHEGEERRTGERKGSGQPMGLLTAFMPYLVLAALAALMLVVPPVREFLGQFSAGFNFPGSGTGLGVTSEPSSPYDPFKVLIHPGTLILITVLATWLLYQRKGLFGKGSARRVFVRAVDESLPATTPFVALVLTAKVMEMSGMMLVLALGTAIVTSPAVYSFVAPWIGALGAFATSSTSGALVLFTPLQMDVATALGLPRNVIAAGHMAGAAAGNAVATLDILIGLLVIGKPWLLGKVLRHTVTWAAIALTLVGAGCLGLYLMGAT